jgi:hypothetical protein
MVQSLPDFGTLEEVTAKLVAAERDKARRTLHASHSRARRAKPHEPPRVLIRASSCLRSRAHA